MFAYTYTYSNKYVIIIIITLRILEKHFRKGTSKERQQHNNGTSRVCFQLNNAYFK